MKLISQTEHTVKIIETLVQKGKKEYLVKDFFDQVDKIVDTTITVDGHAVEDPAEYEEVLEFIDSLD